MATTFSHRWPPNSSHAQLAQRYRALPDVASITQTYSPSVTMTLEHDIGGAKCGIQAVRIRFRRA